MKLIAVVASTILFFQSLAEDSLRGSKDGIMQAQMGRVIGGENAPVGRYPYIAGLKSAAGNLPFCTGSLIAPTIVYSAAHCPAPAGVTLGCQFLDGRCDLISSTQSITHPSFVDITGGFDYRIVVLSSAQSAQTLYVAGPAWSQYGENGEDAMIVGYGELQFGGARPSELQQVELDVVSRQQCDDWYRQFGVPDFRTIICAGRVGVGGCRGDSGGPLAFTGCGDAGRDVLLGITSFVLGQCRTEFNTPTAFARVTEEQSWLTSTLGGLGVTLPTPPGPDAICGGPVPPPVPTPITNPTPEPTPAPVPVCTGWFC